MKLWSDSWTNGDAHPRALCRRQDRRRGGAAFSDNVNPHLAWSELPAGTSRWC